MTFQPWRLPPLGAKRARSRISASVVSGRGSAVNSRAENVVRIASSRSMASPRVSGLVIVLTLPVNEEEGHLSYLSQSAYPAKGTTVGGRTDDPRRERTRNALARHRARAGAGQRQRGVPRAGDLADRLLSLAQPAGTLRGRRRAPGP